MNDDSKPPLTLVSKQNDREIEVKRANEDLRFAIRILAVNLLRLMAGGGKDYEIFRQTKALFDRFLDQTRAIGDGGGADASFVAGQAISEWEWRKHDPRYRRDGEPIDDGDGYPVSAENDMIAASLRIVAARLAGQKSQEANAESRFHEAFRNFTEMRTEYLRRSR